MTEQWMPTSRFGATGSEGANATHEISGGTAVTGPSIYGPASSSYSQMDIVFSGISFSGLTRTNRKPPDPNDLGPGGIYHEKQAGQLCAMHMMNNILQENRVTEEILRKTAKQLDKAQQRLTGGRSTDYMNHRQDGFFNALVVQAVFSGLGYHAQVVRGSMIDIEEEMAFLANKARHWFGCRRLGDGWFDLNSCLEKPEYYDDHEIKEHLQSAEEQGYRLFVVRGDWPPTSLEEDASALADAVRGCLRPLGYRRSKIVCAPGLDIMVDEKNKGVAEHQVPFWLRFSAHWFSPTRFQHHEAGTADDWQAAELGWQKKKVAVKKKTAAGATLQEDKIEQPHTPDAKKEMAGSIMEFLEEQEKEWFDAEIEDTEVALEDEPASRPIFVLTQVSFIILFWMIAAIVSPGSNGWLFTLAGFENLVPGETLCEASTDCKDHRFQIWRWWSYQFTHTGVSHVGMNSFTLLLAGLPVEQFHGTLRTALLFNIGIFVGGIFNMVWNPHSSLAGCSAGCYAIIFAHFAELGYNWRQTRFRWPKLAVLFILVTFDILQSSITAQYYEPGRGCASNSAHIGGAVTGLLIGLCLLRNLVVKRWERRGQIAASLLWLVILAVHFGFLAQWPPSVIGDPEPFCWARQVFNTTVFGDGEYHCVRCADTACIQRWTSSQRWISEVNWELCEYVKGWSA